MKYKDQSFPVCYKSSPTATDKKISMLPWECNSTNSSHIVFTNSYAIFALNIPHSHLQRKKYKFMWKCKKLEGLVQYEMVISKQNKMQEGKCKLSLPPTNTLYFKSITINCPFSIDIYFFYIKTIITTCIRNSKQDKANKGISLCIISYKSPSLTAWY